MNPADLEAFCRGTPDEIAARPGWSEFHEAFLAALESGAVRAASATALSTVSPIVAKAIAVVTRLSATAPIHAQNA